MSESLVYAYGVARGARRPSLGRGSPRLPGGGVPRALPVSPRLWLVVADVPAADFQGEALDRRMHDVDWLSRCGVAHHGVIARLGQQRAVVPFRVFTVFRTGERAVAGAARRRRLLERTLDRVDGCREWVVRAAASPLAGDRGPRLEARSGTEYLLTRAARRRSGPRPPSGASRLVRALASEASGIAKQVVRRRPAAEHGVLLDLALLVPRGREAALSRTLRRWTPRLAERGCRVWRTGPWPPYSFASAGRSSSRAGRRG